jgi:thiol:disulfide interchange protein DsbD
MMATLIWLLYILGRQLGMEAVVWTTAFLLAIGVGCWLIGKYATLSASRLQSWGIWTAAFLLAIGGYWLFLGSVVDAGAAVQASSPSAVPGEHEGILWKPFTLSGLESELEARKAVFIDFTADWCLTCKVNEKTVMSDSGVINKFRQFNVTAFRADWTNRNPDITRLMAKFGRSGVPLYVIFPPGKPNTPIVLPEVITSGIVKEALERAVAPEASADTNVQPLPR